MTHLRVVPAEGTIEARIEERMRLVRTTWAAMGAAILNMESASPRQRYDAARRLERCCLDLGDAFDALATLSAELEDA